MVGALVVAANGAVVGEGWHEFAGGPHAEINALRKAGDSASGATLYVTLEPCSTYGRTPPCTEAIIRAGIARVVVAATDPNPLHAGRGFDILKNAGIAVTSGVMAEDCYDLNLIFNHWIARKQPLFAAKIATTIDGRTATRSGKSKWITGPQAREDAHYWRRYFPAIAVGSGTVLADNPRLTARLPEKPEFCPLRYVFDRSLESVTHTLPYVYSDDHITRTTVVTGLNPPADKEATLRAIGINILKLPDDDTMNAFRERCAKNGITGVLFEGGSRLISALLSSGNADYLFAYRAPILLADNSALPAFAGASPDEIHQGWHLENIRQQTLGPDQLMRGWLKK